MEELIYKYLVLNCIGYDNRIKANVLMNKFNINDNKTFRGYIQAIRQNPEFPRMIGSEAGSSGGYWIIANANEFYSTAKHLEARAREMQKTSEMLQEKFENEKERGF